MLHKQLDAQRSSEHAGARPRPNVLDHCEHCEHSSAHERSHTLLSRRDRSLQGRIYQHQRVSQADLSPSVEGAGKSKIRSRPSGRQGGATSTGIVHGRGSDSGPPATNHGDGHGRPLLLVNPCKTLQNIATPASDTTCRSSGVLTQVDDDLQFKRMWWRTPSAFPVSRCPRCIGRIAAATSSKYKHLYKHPCV